MMLACFFTNPLLSQAQSNSSYNASFWEGYADKLQLGPKERAEFLSSHKRDQSAAPLAVQQNTPALQPFSNKTSGSNNSIFAGPCINADFELGDLTGWVRSCGFHPGYNPLGCCPNPNGQQAIMSGTGNDPYGGFPLVYPGGSYSLRLGNDQTGGQADRIEQTFLVSPSNANFSYKYAVVFEDPNHPANEQPFFQVDMIDSTNAAIPCTFYHVSAGAGIPGFFNSSTAGVIYKPWSTVLVDLTPYIGQNVTIRFSTYDCSLGGHFGYAYIDGVCQSFSGGGSATVCAGASTTFCAPTGVASYTWDGPGVTAFVGQCATATAPGVYTVSTSLFTGCLGPSFTYTLFNQPPPVADAGLSATVCANNNTVNISGSITGFTSTPLWSSSGSGVFTSTTSLNTMYTPSGADIAAGSVTITMITAGNGVCPPATDNMVISITPSPVVNAGTGGTNCNTNPFALNGSVTAGASTGSWTSTGNGTFAPAASVLNASYTPGPADIAAGSVTLTLTSTNNGNCFQDSDTLIIKIRQPAIVNAGVNQLLCSTTPTIGVSGTIGGGGTTGAWSSSGTGAFAPTATNLSASYSVTPADVTAGQVVFTLSSTNNGPCPVVTDTVKMRILQPSLVNAGSSQFLCSTSASVNLNGAVVGFSNTGSWASSGSGTFSPSSSNLNSWYTFTPADINAGLVTFTLTSTNNGPCASVSDTVRMRVRIPATVTAGSNQALCSNTGTVNLSGGIGGGSNTGAWAGSGTGAFVPSNTLINTAYNITAADIASGFVTFTLASTNNGPCAMVQDTMRMRIVNLATVTAGSNLFVCSNAGTLSLAGSINSPSNTGVWSGSGSGSFIPNTSALNTTYSFSPTDINAGTVTFTLSSTNNGVCPVVRDTVKMKIMKLATVNAGPNQFICSTQNNVILAGNVNAGGNAGTWSTSGNGTYNPNASSLNTSYAITPQDITAGSITFTLTSQNSTPCPEVNDTMHVNILTQPVTVAGPSQTICSSSSTVNLSGSVSGGAGSVLWSTSGTGIFGATGNPVTNYIITPADVQAGALSFSLASTNNGACAKAVSSLTVVIKEKAKVNAGVDMAVCSTQLQVPLQGTISGVTSLGTWAGSGSGTISPNAPAGTYIVSPGDISQGNVIFVLTSSNNDVCPVVTDTMKLVIETKPVIAVGADTTLCDKHSLVALSFTATGGSALQWMTSGNGAFLPTNAASASHYSLSAADKAGGVVTLMLGTSPNGPCGYTGASMKVNILRGPRADFSASAYTIQIPGDPIQFTNLSTTADTYTWSFGDGESSTLNNPSHTYADAGFYKATLTVRNNNTCDDVIDKLITVISDVQFPTAFTPNGGGGAGGHYDPNDNSNDVFFPFVRGVVEYDMMIFNRWGELIFRTNDVKIGWDGYFNGKLCQQDTYVWKMNALFFDGRKYNGTGSVTLLK